MPFIEQNDDGTYTVLVWSYTANCYDEIATVATLEEAERVAAALPGDAEPPAIEP